MPAVFYHGADCMNGGIIIIGGGESGASRKKGERGRFQNQPGTGLLGSSQAKSPSRKALDKLCDEYFRSKKNGSIAASKKFIASVKKALELELGNDFKRIYEVKEWYLADTPVSRLDVHPTANTTCSVGTRLRGEVDIFVEGQFVTPSGKRELADALEGMFGAIKFALHYKLPAGETYREIRSSVKLTGAAERAAALQRVIEAAAKQRGGKCACTDFDSEPVNEGGFVVWFTFTLPQVDDRLTVVFNPRSKEAYVNRGKVCLFELDQPDFVQLVGRTAFQIHNAYPNGE